MNDINTAASSVTKRQAQLEALIAKEEMARAERLANLKARLEKEQSKTKELSLENEGMTDLVSMLNNTAEKNGVSVQKLMDFIAKQTIGATAKVVYRRARVAKVAKEPKAPRKVAAKKVAAKK